jgi:putative inorganic carbon (HCO3(-)) transporter
VTGEADGALATSAPAREQPLPETRPRGRLAFVLPLVVAAVAGLAVGWAPHPALVVEAAAVSALVLVPRLEWAALTVVATAVFTDYLDLVSPWATEWLYALLAVAWLVRRAQGRLHGHRLRSFVVPALLVLGAVLVAFVVHPHGRPGLSVCASYAELVVVALLLADCLCGPLAPVRAARAYLLACVVASCCGMVTAVVSDPHRVAGPVAGPDTMAFFLVGALPLVATVRSRADQPGWWIWACYVVLLAAGIGTQSRPAFVALVVMVALAVATGLFAARYAGALLALVITAVALVLAVLPVSIGQALTDPQRYADSGIAERMELRRVALDMTVESPVVGLGPASFALFHHEHRPADAEPADRDLDSAYSTPLEVSAELGVLGLLALGALWLLPAVGAVRRWELDWSGLRAGSLLAGAGLLTASLLESQQLTLPLWFVAALLLALGRPDPPWVPLLGAGDDDRSSGQVPPRS